MRIALVVPEFPPDIIGGGGLVFEALGTGLHERGHSVKVLTSSTWRGAVHHDERYPFPILRAREFRHFSERFRTYMPPVPQSVARMRAFLADRDVFSLHGYGVPLIDVAFHCAVKRPQTVFTTHGFPYTARRSRGLLGLGYATYDMLVGRRILLESAALTAVSTLLARETGRVAQRPVHVIPNALTPLREGAPRRAIVEQADRGPYLLCVGKLESLKRFDHAMCILKLLRDEGARLRLLIAGGDFGAERKLRAFATSLGLKHSVSFLGRVERDQLAWLYPRAAAVLVTSVTESFSLVTLEALSCGAACVLSAVGGVLDMARDGENALLFPCGDVGAAVQAVRRVRAEHGLNERLRTNAQATADRFSWPRVVAEYEAILQSVAAR